jgi:hypothetical protein
VDLYFFMFRFWQGVKCTLPPRTFREHSPIAFKRSELELFIMAFRNFGFAGFISLSVWKLDRMRFMTYAGIDYRRIFVREDVL